MAAKAGAGGAKDAKADKKPFLDLDSAAGQIIYKDLVRKEQKALSKAPPAVFSANPLQVKVISDAIGKPAKAIDPETLRSLRTMVEETTEKPPNKKYPMPQTASQEVGWFAAEEYEVPPFKAVHKCSEEVEFAIAYFNTTGCMPHAKTQKGGRG